MGSGGYFSNAGVFLVDVVFGLYIFAVLLRFLFQLVRADFYNPLCQAIVTVTNPPLRPLRRYIPSLGGLDTASIVLLVALQMLNTFLVTLVLGLDAAAGGLLVVAIAELLGKTLWTFIGAIIIQVVLSWVAPGTYNPLTSVIHALTEPLLGPARRAIPPLGPLDLSPLVVLVGLQLAQILVVAPLRDAGVALL
ncbi:MAG: YggT family protein [Gammaproteobacteria bacterium]